MMNTNVKDAVTWPVEEKKAERPMNEDELKKKRLEESKYEDPKDH